MLFTFGLLMLLIPTCVEMFCRFNQTDPCYAALGHKLYLQMVTDARDQDLELYKWIDNEKEKVFRVKNKKEKKNETHKSIRNRSEFIFNNGTLIINSVKRTDSGTYTLELYDSTGRVTHAVDFPVNIEAPIGSVKVSIKCWSSGEKRASCSSEGDQLIFIWTLNGQKLEDGNNIIHLDEETSGSITCTVNNHVSQGQNTISVNRCPGTTTATVTSHLTSAVTNSTQTSGHGTSSFIVAVVVVLALGFATLILNLLVISVYHIYKKKKQLKPAAATTGDDTELMYTCITHKKLNKEDEHKRSELSLTVGVEYAAVNPQTKMKMEEDIQYGEGTFTAEIK